MFRTLKRKLEDFLGTGSNDPTGVNDEVALAYKWSQGSKRPQKDVVPSVLNAFSEHLVSPVQAQDLESRIIAGTTILQRRVGSSAEIPHEFKTALQRCAAARAFKRSSFAFEEVENHVNEIETRVLRMISFTNSDVKALSMMTELLCQMLDEATKVYDMYATRPHAEVAGNPSQEPHRDDAAEKRHQKTKDPSDWRHFPHVVAAIHAQLEACVAAWSDLDEEAQDWALSLLRKLWYLKEYEDAGTEGIKDAADFSIRLGLLNDCYDVIPNKRAIYQYLVDAGQIKLLLQGPFLEDHRGYLNDLGHYFLDWIRNLKLKRYGRAREVLQQAATATQADDVREGIRDLLAIAAR